MRPSTVVTLTPSRGLIHSRTVEAVLAAQAQAYASETARSVGWLVTHDLPIPECHERLAERGLATGANYLWFVEEDMAPPPDALMRLITWQRETGAGVVLMDYPVGEHPTRHAILRQPDGAVVYGGLGCALITRTALERIPRPWFRTAHEYALRRDRNGFYTLSETERPYTYGGLDVAFCAHARAQGVLLTFVEGQRAGHARLRALGKPQDNHGVHSIDVLTDVEA